MVLNKHAKIQVQNYVHSNVFIRKQRFIIGHRSVSISVLCQKCFHFDVRRRNTKSAYTSFLVW